MKASFSFSGQAVSGRHFRKSGSGPLLLFTRILDPGSSKFLDRIDSEVPENLDIHLVLDNNGTHKTQRIPDWFAKRPRYQLHFTPTSASWISQAERWFGLLAEREVRRGNHRSTSELEKTIKHYIATNNEDPKPFIWNKNADQILGSIKRFFLRTSNTE